MTPKWIDDVWTCEIALPAWRPFLYSQATDVVEVVFEQDHASADIAPSEAQVETVKHLLAAQDEIRSAVEIAVRAYYDEVRPKYVAFAVRVPDFMGDPATSMPENPDASTFARLHELNGVFVHPIVARGLAYVGFSFHAAWEPEHGLGVMTHDRRVIDVGSADQAFSPWAAEKDAAQLGDSSACSE